MFAWSGAGTTQLSSRTLCSIRTGARHVRRHGSPGHHVRRRPRASRRRRDCSGDMCFCEEHGEGCGRSRLPLPLPPSSRPHWCAGWSSSAMAARPTDTSVLHALKSDVRCFSVAAHFATVRLLALQNGRRRRRRKTAPPHRMVTAAPTRPTRSSMGMTRQRKGATPSVPCELLGQAFDSSYLLSVARVLAHATASSSH